MVQGPPTAGLGAADFANRVYGSAGQQMADPAQGNVIQMKNVGGRRRKGKSRRGKSRKGGYGLTNVLVPAALIAANYALGKRKSSRFGRSLRRGSRRFRRSGRR